LRDSLRGLGAQAADTGSQIVAARFPDHNLSHLIAELKHQRILVAARHGHLRVSPHFYNNEDDVDQLVQSVAANLSTTLA
jgi:selenocysteine lyase/cysteine desulfurase